MTNIKNNLQQTYYNAQWNKALNHINAQMENNVHKRYLI